jgi:hypothetical protein
VFCTQGLTTLILGLFVVILGSGVFQVDWATAHTMSDWGAATKVGGERGPAGTCPYHAELLPAGCL